MPVLVEWPQWVSDVVRSLTIVAAAYGAGYLLKFVVGIRVLRLVTRTRMDWDDALVAEVDRRIPFWSLLGGTYVALRLWPLDPERFGAVFRGLSALGLASVTFAAAAVAARLVSSYGPRASPTAPVSALVQNAARFLVLILGGLAIVKSTLGYDITPYLTALGVGGLAVALALQDPLSNFFAGMSMGVSGQVRIGDYVKLDSGAEGYVADFNWRATTIRMTSSNLVIVPNAKLAQAIVTNFSDPAPDVAVVVDLSVAYESDLVIVERVTTDVAIEVMRDVPGGMPTAEPAVRFHTFGPTGVTLSVAMRAREFTDQVLVRHELLKRLHVRYRREGIVLPSMVPVDPRGPAPDEPVA